jgi:hypothetical protein
LTTDDAKVEAEVAAGKKATALSLVQAACSLEPVFEQEQAWLEGDI